MDKKRLSPAALQGFESEREDPVFGFEETKEKEILGKKLELWLKNQDPAQNTLERQQTETWIFFDIPLSTRLQNGPK